MKVDRVFYLTEIDSIFYYMFQMSCLNGDCRTKNMAVQVIHKTWNTVEPEESIEFYCQTIGGKSSLTWPTTTATALPSATRTTDTNHHSKLIGVTYREMKNHSSRLIILLLRKDFLLRQITILKKDLTRDSRILTLG